MSINPIGAVNSPPVATGQAVSLTKNTPSPITLTATDSNGDALTYTITVQPAHGTLSGTPPQITFNPAVDYVGTDSFTFRANDGVANSNAATVTLTISDVATPTAIGQSVALDESTSIALVLQGSSPNGQPLAYEVTRPPEHGVLTGVAPALTYKPDIAFSGTDSFAFRVKQQDVASTPAEVAINVSPVVDNLAGGGVGCVATGDERSLAPVALALVILLLFRRRKAVPWLAAVAALVAPPAVAQSTGLPPMAFERLRMNVGGEGGIVTDSGLLIEKGRLRIAAVTHYERAPLIYLRAGERVGAVVNHRWTNHLLIAGSPTPWLEVGGQLPWVMYQRGQDLSAFGLDPPAVSSLGAAGVQARLAPWKNVTPLRIDPALTLGLTFPLGSPNSLATSGAVGFVPRLSAGKSMTPNLRLATEVAMAFEPTAHFRDAVLTRRAVELAVGVHSLAGTVLWEVSSRTAIPMGAGALGSEVLGGVRLPFSTLKLEAFGVTAIGLGRAPGTPLYRALVGVAYRPL